MNDSNRIFWCILLIKLHMSLIEGKILRLSCGFYSDFSVAYKQSRLAIGILDKIQVKDDLDCVEKCILNDACQSINYSDDTKSCELLKNTIVGDGYNATFAGSWTHYETDPTNEEVGDVCSSTSPCKGHYCEDICEHPGFNCTCRDGKHGERCEKLPKSCKWINENYPALKSGYYVIELQKPTSVYCDMETLGGGWTKFGHVVQNGSISNTALTGQINSDDISSLSDISTGKFLLSVAGLADLRLFINFTQFRFYCYKPRHHRTIHIATTNNMSNTEVVDYLTGKTDLRPPACQSYVKLRDDTSRIAIDCMRWEGQKWSGYHVNLNRRLYDHLIYVPGEYHVNLYTYRLECDDNVYEMDPTISESKGEWLFFVR